MTHHKQSLFIIALICCLCSFMLSCDTLGGIGDTVSFRTSKDSLETAIDSLYAKYPEYKMPEKWAQYDNLAVKSSAALEKKVFYFKSSPEEMYYVSLINDSALMGHKSRRVGLAIRAVNQGSGKWLLNENLDFKQQNRVQKRFEKEIISKLKAYTGVKVSEEE